MYDWFVVQLDHDEKMVPMHGMYGTLEADLEAMRTTKRPDLTAFFCLLRRIIGPTTAHVDNKGILDVLWRGEINCIGPKAKDADLWMLIWQEVHRAHQGGILL